MGSTAQPGGHTGTWNNSLSSTVFFSILYSTYHHRQKFGGKYNSNFLEATEMDQRLHFHYATDSAQSDILYPQLASCELHESHKIPETASQICCQRTKLRDQIQQRKPFNPFQVMHWEIIAARQCQGNFFPKLIDALSTPLF